MNANNAALDRAVELMIDSYKKGGKLMVCGNGGGKMKDCCDVLIESGERETYLVQEEHIRFYHEFCARVEAAFFGE